MKIEELRHGNIIEFEGKPCFFRILEGRDLLGHWHYNILYENLINGSTGSYFDRSVSEQIKPIPLTEEWLLKLGFSCSEGVCDLTHEDSGSEDYFNLNWDVESGLYLYLHEGWICLLKIKSIHQLQNLYFALTGEELEIKNP